MGTTGVKKTRATDQLAKADAQRRTAAAWRQSQAGHMIEVPSGNLAMLRRPGPEMFLKAGAIPDSLTPLVEASIRDKQGLPPEKVAELATDGKMLPQVMDMIDAAVVAACVEPTVVANPTCVRPMGTDEAKVCGLSGGNKVHVDSSARGHHDFIAGDAIPEGERDPDFLYAAEIDYTDKVFIFQFAVGGSADLERFRAEFEQSMASVDSVEINRD